MEPEAWIDQYSTRDCWAVFKIYTGERILPTASPNPWLPVTGRGRHLPRGASFARDLGGGPRHSKRAMERAAFRPIDFLNMEKIAKKGYRGKSPGPVLGSVWDVNKWGHWELKTWGVKLGPQIVNSGPGLRKPKATTLLGDLKWFKHIWKITTFDW